MAKQLALRDRLGLQPTAWPQADHLLRQTRRALTKLDARTSLRLAHVQSEGLVQTEKAKEVDRLTREAMTGHAMLTQWRDTLAHGDLFLADELKFFTDMARIGKGEIIADTIDAFCRESRGGRS
jgi:hypothetical protein